MMKLGIDCFLQSEYKFVKGKRVGLLSNLTGVNRDLHPSIDLLHQHPEVNLVSLFAPEHGIRGDAKEGEHIDSSIDPHTGLPVYSLYGKTRKPTPNMLEEVDVILFDLQDIGSRYYTYIYTMAYMMEACQENKKALIVLDRPNPIGGLSVEGTIVEEAFRSFVGLLPLTNRHGMTVGELACFFKEEFGYKCELHVVKMEGWTRNMFYDDTNLSWVLPSPNAPTLDMAILYPGTCLLEGTNVSEGRGTTKPFEQFGAPFIDGYALAKAVNALQLPGVIARQTSFVPTYQKYNGEQCHGIQLHLVNRNLYEPVSSGIKIIHLIAQLYPDDFTFVAQQNGHYMFDLLAGTDTLRNAILQNDLSSYLEKKDRDTATFLNQRAPYLLYS
ncbi:exo-beta-N-acetylmuramidase NamZ domain-containing protein [Shouchella sp. JSM 1781072]|uniref:exo-beta-N-acetylmuramidase NamZ family protein n=1 Tax=Shouchella sp. JSM 1781072 TaxID=3344581 RepID=UPI0035BF0E83